MIKLREELQRAKENMFKAGKQYVRNSTKQNYDWWKCCEQYYKGLQKAFDLIEGVEE